VRKDQVQPDHLVFGGMGKEGRVPWKPGKLGGSVRIIRNNIYYIGNLFALRHWYDQVRRPFISPRFPEELHAGLLQTLDQGLNERVHRLRLFIEGLNMVKLARAWEAVEVAWSDRAKERGHGALRDTFLDQLASLRRTGHGAYLETIQALPQDTAAIGTQWLTSIVDEIVTSGLPMEN
jgi:UDP-N-acetylglucosamine/UDP-N-acetylgalactosamine diphosphorylase